jgi:hypothetical protein
MFGSLNHAQILFQSSVKCVEDRVSWENTAVLDCDCEEVHVTVAERATS